MPIPTVLAVAAASEPAGGAAIGQVILATSIAAVATAGLLWLVTTYRQRRGTPLERVAGFSERVSALPSWAALPAGVAGGALIIALLGMYWDISLHIDNGRDPGPLANPAHYLILIGLYGVFAAGVLSMVRAGTERPAKSAIRRGGDWWTPVGGAMMTACGAFALSGFPLD